MEGELVNWKMATIWNIECLAPKRSEEVTSIQHWPTCFTFAITPRWVCFPRITCAEKYMSVIKSHHSFALAGFYSVGSYFSKCIHAFIDLLQHTHVKCSESIILNESMHRISDTSWYELCTILNFFKCSRILRTFISITSDPSNVSFFCYRA